MNKFRYHEMLPHEIVERRKRFPAAFIGCGGLEWHGDHLAAGNDALKAEKLCELAAQASGGFAFPTIWYGEPRTARLIEANSKQRHRVRARMGFRKERFLPSYYPKSPEAQVRFFQDLITHVLVQMSTLEMKAVCLLCGHYPLAPWARVPVAAFNRRCRGTRAFAGAEFDYVRRNPSVGGDHAGKWETSYLMHLRPECADLSVYRSRNIRRLTAVSGDDPRETASRELGRIGCDRIAAGMVRKARSLLWK